MLVRVLGAVSLMVDGTPQPVRGTRQPALLAALTARAGEVVSVDRLVDLLWPEDPPDNPSAALHSAVFKLRAQLADASGREVLQRRERGYVLDVEPGDVDGEVFVALVQDARDQPPEEAADTLRSALDLWRGRAYDGYADTDLARLEAIRLEELRQVAVERYGAALQAAKRHDDAVTVLQPFVAEHRLREGAIITLMQALHAQGRTAEALDQFQEHRRELADELGLEPSTALQEAQRQVLQSPEPQVPADPPAVRRGLPDMQVRYLRTEAGQTIAYGTTGTGPPVVVLLGWVSSLHVLASGRDPRSALLERLTDRLTLTLFDRAGTGLSPGPVKDYSLPANVAELEEVIRAVGPPVSLLAMSSAGPIALTLAHRRPEWVTSMVLWGTFADGPGTFTAVNLRNQVIDITRSHWRIGSKLLADLYRPGIGDEAAWHLAEVFRASASGDVAASYLQYMYDQDVTALLPEIETPTLVLHYRGDRLIPFGGGLDIASGLPHARLVPLDGVVHLPDARDTDVIERAVVEHVLRQA